MASTYSDHGSVEVVDEGPLEILPEVDEVRLEDFEPSERNGFNGNREVERLGRVGSTRHLDGTGVAANPLAWVLLTVVLGDADWFEVLGVGTINDIGGDHGEAVTIISIVVYVRSVSSPCLNDALRIATIIDLLPQINCRRVL
jgi:hypothetical protein